MPLPLLSLPFVLSSFFCVGLGLAMYHGLSPLQPVETLIAQLVREVRARVWRLLLLLFFFFFHAPPRVLPSFKHLPFELALTGLAGT